MDSWVDLENIMISLSDGGTKVANGAVNLAQTVANQMMPTMKQIKAKVYKTFHQD